MTLGAATLPGLLAGCSVWNETDICDPPALTAVDLNQRTDDDQVLSPGRALAPLPSGGLIGVFDSRTVDTDGRIERVSVRARSLTPMGQPASTCGDTGDVTLAANAVEPAVSDDGGLGRSLTVGFWGVLPGSSELAVYGLALDASNGCDVFEADPLGAFLLSDAASVPLRPPLLVPMGGEETIALWATRDAVMGRRFTAPNGVLEFLSLRDAVTGDRIVDGPAQVSPPGAGILVDVDAVPAPVHGAPGLAWLTAETRQTGTEVLLARGDVEGRTIPGDPVVVGRFPLRNLLADVGLGFDGESLLAVWTGPASGDELSRPWPLYGRVVPLDGGPAGEPFLMDDDGDHDRVVVMGVRGRGFLVAWVGAATDATDGGEIRAKLLTGDGGGQLDRRSCGRSSFVVADRGTLRRPSLTRLVGGEVAIAFDGDDVEGSLDTDGSGARVVLGDVDALWP